MSAKVCWPIVAVAGLGLVSACQSSPATHYYALTEMPPTTARATNTPPIPIRLERVTIPGELDRLEMVRHGSANRLQIAAFDRWAAPLDEMIRRVVLADLAARLAAGSMASANEPTVGEPRRHLYIDIQDFSADARGAVTLHAAWLLQTPDATSTRGSEEIAVAASDASAEGLATAMSRALAELSERLVAALTPHADSTKSE